MLEQRVQDHTTYLNDKYERLTTAIVNIPMKLKMIFYWWYIIFTDGYTDVSTRSYDLS